MRPCVGSLHTVQIELGLGTLRCTMPLGAQRQVILVCATPVAAAALYRSTLNLRLRIARRRKLAGWASTAAPDCWGNSRITYIPQHDALMAMLGILFPPLLFASVHKWLWWELLSVPEVLLQDAEAKVQLAQGPKQLRSPRSVARQSGLSAFP